MPAQPLPTMATFFLETELGRLMGDECDNYEWWYVRSGDWVSAPADLESTS